jgi:MoaA/NifB/PqqE/SkfB family radical SAM enzyme
MTDNSDTWCPLPWIHTCVRPDNVLKPCCRFQVDHASNPAVNLDSIEEHGIDAMNHSYWTQLRKDMLAGVKRKECSKCHVQEETKLDDRGSMRQFLSKRFSSVITNDDCKEQFDSLRYIEMSIDNICNLQCKMCDSKFSSRLQLRDKFLGNTVHKKLEPNFKKFDNVDLSKLVYVKLLGGEPFMTPNFIKFIDYLLERVDPNNVSIEIATNGTVIPSKEVIEKLNQFNILYINVSLDSMDLSNDYQRHGSSYITIFNNTKLYETIFKNIHVSIHSVISILNANTLANTLDVLIGQHNYHVSVDFVRDPGHLSLLYAPTDFLNKILEINSSNNTAYKLISTFIKSANYNKAIWQEFLNSIPTLDNFYNTDLKDYNMFLYNYINFDGTLEELLL